MYRMIDLFCGAGGMSLGFTDTRYGGGFKSIWAVDNDAAATKTFAVNFGPHVTCGDIVELAEEADIPKTDVVVGGPPCQGFSLLNKQRHHDPRRQLWRPYLDIVSKSGADVFVIENVPGLLTSPEGEEIIQSAEELGFTVFRNHLVAADYGVPQTRKRAVLVGVKTYLATYFDWPLPTHSQEEGGNLKPWRTVRDAIGDLDSPQGTEIRQISAPYDLHFGRRPTETSIKRYKAVPPGGNRFDLQKNAPHITPQCWIRKKSGGTDLFGRLWWDRPSVTIRTEFFKPEKGRYLHPEQHRPITHREAARLMGFPDDFQFRGSKIEIARQIGNAVPPAMAGAIAQAVFRVLAARERMVA